LLLKLTRTTRRNGKLVKNASSILAECYHLTVSYLPHQRILWNPNKRKLQQKVDVVALVVEDVADSHQEVEDVVDVVALVVEEEVVSLLHVVEDVVALVVLAEEGLVLLAEEAEVDSPQEVAHGVEDVADSKLNCFNDHRL
jgi:hypothetical protein